MGGGAITRRGSTNGAAVGNVRAPAYCVFIAAGAQFVIMLNPTKAFKNGNRFRALVAALALGTVRAVVAQEQPAAKPAAPTQHPALFLVGDSIMKTGSGTGEKGPWGWGSELGAFMDPAKLHVYNEGHGGRSSRSFIEEELWGKVLDQLKPGDFVLVGFGHNDSANSKDHPNRISLKGSGDETQETNAPGTDKKQTLHSYGWYLRQYIKDAKSKGATVIICSPIPRNTWENGKIKRGFGGYAKWAEEAAKAGGALFLDLNTLAANRYDAMGEQKTATYFADRQHTTKAGARLNAEAAAEGMAQFKNCELSKAVLAASGK